MSECFPLADLFLKLDSPVVAPREKRSQLSQPRSTLRLLPARSCEAARAATSQCAGTNGFACKKQFPREQVLAAKDCQTNSRNQARAGGTARIANILPQARLGRLLGQLRYRHRGERAQTAGLKAGGGRRQRRARQPGAPDQHREQTPPRTNGESGTETMGSPDGQRTGDSGESEDPDRAKKMERAQETLHAARTQRQQPKTRSSWWPRTQIRRSRPEGLTALILLTDQLNTEKGAAGRAPPRPAPTRPSRVCCQPFENGASPLAPRYLAARNKAWVS